MSRAAVVPLPQTYIANLEDHTTIVEIARTLQAVEGALSLSTADGQRVVIPSTVLEALRLITESLADGLGVSVAPLNAVLTTQEAADYLGVSRPTLVRILERGELPMEKPGRHRFVRLADLIDFQARQRVQRGRALDEMQRRGEADGLYDLLEGQS